MGSRASARLLRHSSFLIPHSAFPPMPANTHPVHAKQPVVGRARAVVANTNRDGTGIIAWFEWEPKPGPAGLRVEQVYGQALTTTANGMARLWLKSPSGVISARGEESITGTTVSGTVKGATALF